MNFIDDIQTSASMFLMELVVRRGGDVIDVNIKNHLPMDRIHP